MHFEIAETDNGWKITGRTHWDGAFEYHYKTFALVARKLQSLKKRNDKYSI